MSSLRFPLVLLALLSTVALLVNVIAPYIGPLEYTGHLTFSYTEGENPIVNVVFQFNEEIGESLIVVNAPSPWSWAQGGNILSMSGGSLAPGDSLVVAVSFNRYVPPGDRPFTAVGTTSGGESSTALGVLVVTEMILLKILYTLSQNQLYLFGGTTVLFLGEIFRRWFQGRPIPPLKPGLGDGGIEQPVDTGSGIRTRERGSGEGSGTITTGEDGDDPRDIPPPKSYGEEIETDLKTPPVYIVSDFHIGSNRNFPGQVDKRRSNDMDQKTLKEFLKWLDLVDKDAADYDQYDVVMNGDFLDLWQSARPKDDDYQKRLEDILETNPETKSEANPDFFSELGKFIRKNSPRCRFYYVIGNHDDPLYSGNHSGDEKFGEGNSFNSLRNRVKEKLREQSNSLMSFAMNRQYTNANYKLFVEHGHQHDSTNLKDENGGPSGGQQIAQQINHMQETDPLFENIENTPNQETAKYLHCLNRQPGTPEDIKKEIEKLKEISIDAEAYVVGNVVDFLLTDDGMSNAIIDRIDPDNIKKNELEEALEIINDIKRIPPRKIVVFGHTHIHDLQPPQPYSQWAYANSGTWLDDITHDSTEGCQLRPSPSSLPYVKVSKEKGEDIALVELKFFRGTPEDRLVKVQLT
jgi:UDP-2,3-diacylglucosamine pyrophosphatase LpxH